ncbi:MAG TPA: hypothetical protein VMS31_19615 [Pyrinomonadaceae bacterium]|nr:hypothetical protein [Pyrinomonadaceae bacterium]
MASLPLQVIEHEFIYVTPPPLLAGLERFDDGMMTRMEVPRRMLIRRGVAATNVSAGQTDSQVQPDAANPQAVFTTIGARFHWPDLIKV